MGLGDQIRTALALGGGVTPPPGNDPAAYADQERQYFRPESARFAERYGRYASNTVSAQAQGLDDANPLDWEPVTIRLAEIVRAAASMTRRPDDYKMVLLVDPALPYVPPGAKFVTMGSTWLCTAPENVGSAYGTGLLEKCNATWNHLDWYGNVLREPIAVSNTLARASSPDPQGLMMITKGYFDVKCQANEWTRQLNTNSRMLLGKGAYAVTGFSDFNQEFTTEAGSVGVIEFTLRYEDVNESIDDRATGVAGGKTFSWTMTIQGPRAFRPGETGQLSASSVRCGLAVDPADGAHPVHYLWESTDPAVVTVDGTGRATGQGPGVCEIVCTVAENPAIQERVTVTVDEGSLGRQVVLDPAGPVQMEAYTDLILSARCYENGAEVPGAAVTWRFSGAAEQAWTAEVVGNHVTVSCWAGAEEPLLVTAQWGEAAAGVDVVLLGI